MEGKFKKEKGNFDDGLMYIATSDSYIAIVDSNPKERACLQLTRASLAGAYSVCIYAF